MDSQNRKRKFDRRSGQVMIFLTLMMVPMFGLLGLVCDVGYMHFVKMSAQTAAEAAASAAVINMHKTLGGASLSCTTTGVTCASTPTNCTANITTPTNSVEVGCMYAQTHGFTGSNQWVTYQSGVNGTPPTASGSGSASYWITYRAVQKVPQMFSAILGDMSGLVAARSTGTVTGASDCIYALNPSVSGAVSVGGTATLSANCGLYVDSNSGTAIQTWGGGTISTTEIDIVGNTTSSLTPTPNTGVSPVSDPLAYLPVPASATYTCDHYNYSSGVSNWSNPTLSPGVYCGGLQIDHNVYALNAGTYILVGGGLTVGANGGVTGTDVLIYNTFGATTTHGTINYGSISIVDNATPVTLKASNSGTYAGILFFEDRNAPKTSGSGGPATGYYGGGGSAAYQGTIYTPNAAVTMQGGSSVSAKYTLLVCDTISMVGNPTFNDDYSLLPNGSPIQKVAVVE